MFERIRAIIKQNIIIIILEFNYYYYYYPYYYYKLEPSSSIILKRTVLACTKGEGGSSIMRIAITFYTLSKLNLVSRLKSSRNIPEFSNYISVFITHSFYVSHSRLRILKKIFFILLIFQAPQKCLNMQKPKDAQNGLKLS